MNYIDTIFGFLGGGASFKIFDFLLAKYRNKEQLSKDKSSAKKEELSVAEQAMELVKKYGEKIETLTVKVEQQEVKIREQSHQIEELTKENIFLKGQMETFGKMAKASIPTRKNL
jgi:predicted RNase H-like nuclease (RuvC/YqgF family)